MRKQPTLTVTKTVSMPLELMNAVNDEAFVMGKGFSECLTLLLQLGIRKRRESEAAMKETLGGTDAEIEAVFNRKASV